MAVQIIAHRGAPHRERENTLAAFVRACHIGADAVELDVRRTRDGVLVVHHDPTLPGGGPALIDLDRSELPDHIPDLGAALDACGTLWVNVEIKNDPAEVDFDPADDIAEELTRALAARGEPSRWLISSFRFDTIERCRRVEPAIATAWLVDRVAPDTLERVVEGGHRALHPHWSGVEPALIRRCHRRGVGVNVWTCDDPVAMVALAAAGVDGICTNAVEMARRALGR
jgi:glycerophosphoryl diester phosphodiesterase